MIVAGLDLSMTSTGIALSTGRLLRVESKGGKDATLDQRCRRLGDLTTRILAALEPASYVVVEQPSYGSSGGSAHDRSGLWWLCVGGLIASGVPVAEVVPTTRARYVVGYAQKGVKAPRSDKDACMAAVCKRFPSWNVTGNDEADALTLLAMGCDHFGQPLAVMPESHRRALTAVRWPAVSDPAPRVLVARG